MYFFERLPRTGQRGGGLQLDKEVLGPKLKRLRIARFGSDQTYSEFARISGVSKGSMKDIEEGRSSPLAETLEKWILGCGMTLQEFFMDEKESSRPHLYFDKKYSEFYTILNHILQYSNSEQKDSLRAQLQTFAKLVSIPDKRKARQQ